MACPEMNAAGAWRGVGCGDVSNTVFCLFVCEALAWVFVLVVACPEMQ